MSEVAVRNPLQEVCTTIASDEFGQKIAQALPPNITLDRFTRVTLTAVQQNPELILADRQSLYNSVIRCAQDGLIPDGREAALVIFSVKGEKKVQYLPMIFGLRKKAAEHGFSITAYTVHEHDDFEYEIGLSPTIRHKPPKLGTDRGEIIGAYSVATDKRTGEQYLEVMSRDEIEQVRAVSRAATSEYGPWVKWYGEQCRKTVARRNYKQIPLGAVDESTERVLNAIDAEYDLPQIEKRMTADEVNLHATLGSAKPPNDTGPEDSIEGTATDADEPAADAEAQTAFPIPDAAKQS
jgi:recombination protein RecT